MIINSESCGVLPSEMDFDALAFAIRLGPDVIIRKKRENEPGLLGGEMTAPSSDRLLRRLAVPIN